MTNRAYRKTSRELADYKPGDDLREQIERHRADHGKRCSFVASPCLTPDFDVLDDRQTAYYLFIRECIRNGSPVRSDAGYSWLLMIDLINDRADPESVMAQFGKLYKAVVRQKADGYPPPGVLSNLMYCYAIANDLDCLAYMLPMACSEGC